MATHALVMADNKVSVGRIFERAFKTLRENPVLIFIVAIVFGGAPSTFIEYFLDQIPPNSFVMTFWSIYIPGPIALMFVKWFFGLVVAVILQGALTVPVIACNAGEKARFGPTFMITLKRLPQLIFLGVILGLGVVIGGTLLLIPALFVYVLWAMAAPALVAEGDGVFLSLSRSQELGEGARGKTIGALAILFVFSLVVGVGLAIVSPLIGDVGSVRIGFILVLATLSQLVWAIVQVSLYVELRDWKEGPTADNLEAVFA